ncbi:MAG: MlaD family protein [Spirochaetes bacterium]|nr:MlaD family protein [Spirochaetota bacterium]
MKFRIRFADQLVGVFLLIAVLAIAAILVFVGINQRWFAKNYEFRSRFDSAGGLSVGMPIMLKGFEIGEVRRIELNDDNQVDVLFSVQDTYYDKILPNSVLELTSSPFGLGVTLNFHSGAGAGLPQPELSFIPSLDLPEGQDLVSAGLVVIPKGEDVIGSVIGKINPILDDVRTALIQIKRVVGTVDLALQGKGGPVGEMVVDLSRTPDKVNALIDDVNARIVDISQQANAAIGSFGTVAATAQDTIDSLSADLNVIAANIKTTTDGLTETRGLVTRLLDPKGSVATILDDKNALYGQIEGSLKQVQDAVTGVNRIVEQVNAFVDYLNGTRPQISGILETGRTTLEKGNEVLEAVKNNPLLRGGVPESKEQTTTLKSYRDEDF